MLVFLTIDGHQRGADFHRGLKLTRTRANDSVEGMAELTLHDRLAVLSVQSTYPIKTHYDDLSETWKVTARAEHPRKRAYSVYTLERVTRGERAY